jgi:cyclic pyranopterin phosphate synthase
MELTHLDAEGRVQMVDVGEKPDTERVAVAKGEVTMRPETLRLIAEKGVPKGDVLAVAQVAGIMAAKHTPDLIPLCHPLLITKADVEFEIDEEASRIIITATVRCRGKTGVEMEALTGVSVAALTIYDMAKAVEKTMRIGNIRLVRKSGGKSGEWTNERMDSKCVRVKVRFFAAPREALGTGEIGIELPAGTTVGELIGRLTAEHPVLRPYTRFISVAVNRAYVGMQTKLHDGDEVACLPPVGGG